MTAAPTAGYSGTPLAKKLGIKPGMSVCALRAAIGPDAALWVSWPKKAARVPTDVTEDVIRELALPLGLVDVKVCAVDATWSGLKLVIRRELRDAASTGRAPKR
jgi:hypothetical protein